VALCHDIVFSADHYDHTAMKATQRSSARMPITLDTRAVTEEVMSASKFLELARTNPSLIKSSRVIMPSPGKPGFGGFIVQYAYPQYRAA